jgi:hypothetical protein
MANGGYLRYTKLSPNRRKVFKHIRRIHGKNLCVHGEDAKRILACSPNTQRDIKVWISPKIIRRIKIVFRFIHGLSQKTNSCYCPFKPMWTSLISKSAELTQWFLCVWNIPFAAGVCWRAAGGQLWGIGQSGWPHPAAWRLSRRGRARPSTPAP